MGVRWRAWYSDSEWCEGPYHAIDRSRLVRFSIYPDALALRPAWSVDVPADRNLVYRTRNFVGGVNGFLVLVALEDADRAADVWILDAECKVFYLRDYDPTHVETRAPVLYDFERVLTPTGA
jgi:hypothetical protein